jgi:hypothetical protein
LVPFLLGILDFQEVIRAARGQTLAVLPQVQFVEATSVGEKTVRWIQISNEGDSVIRIIGGDASCGCLVYEDLPLEIAPHSTGSLKVSITMKSGYGRYRHRFVLHTNQKNQPYLQGGLTGWLNPKPKEG